MYLGVLGPLLANEGDTSHVPQAPKRRQLLALLVMHANTPVPTEDCVGELWDGNPPHSAVRTVQTYVMQLRRRSAEKGGTDGLGARIVTGDCGYLFRAEPGELDADRFAGLVATAHDATARADHRAAAATLTQALKLWRGPALADVKVGPLLRSKLVGLTESRMCALERRIEADLSLGRHHVLLDELATLVAAHPTHENFHAQLLVALCRSGRPDEAVLRYEWLRRTLADELGLTPSTRMRGLYRAVLDRDPRILAATEVTSSGRR